MALLSYLNVVSVWFILQGLVTVICVYVACKCTKYFFGFTFGEVPKQPLKSGSLGRRLGYFEGVFDLLSLEKGGTGNICIAISLTSEQSLLHQHVRDALVLLVKRQPMLRATITTMENEEKYFEIKEVNEVITMLDITTSDVKASNWKDVWFEYTAKRRGNGLLWRVLILQEEYTPDTKEYANTLMFSFNHSSTDGVSCVKFCKQFINCMNELASGTICVEKDVSSLNLLPYFHDIVTQKRVRYSLLNFLLTYCGVRPILKFFMRRMIARLIQTKQCNPFFVHFPPKYDDSIAALPCQLIAKVFTEIETRKITQACKENHCTVTGALTAAAHLAFCELLPDGVTKDKSLNLQHSFAINAKRYCDPKPHEDYLGCFVYMFDEFYMKYVADTDVSFWKIAQSATQQIRDFVIKEEYIIDETMIKETMKPRELLNLLDRELLNRFSVCCFISSFGSFNFHQNREQQALYKLHECFVNNVGHDFPGIFSHFNHTVDGKMTWQIMYEISRVDTCHAKTFAKLCFGRFIDIASGV